METNKTPMTLFFETGGYTLDSDFCKEWLQKEKQFAFDCFEAGKAYGFDVCMATEWGLYPTKPDFEQFYHEYAEQHKK